MVVGGGGVVVEIFAELKISYGGADAPRRFMARYRVCVVYLRARHYSKVLFDVFFCPPCLSGFGAACVTTLFSGGAECMYQGYIAISFLQCCFWCFGVCCYNMAFKVKS